MSCSFYVTTFSGVSFSSPPTSALSNLPDQPLDSSLTRARIGRSLMSIEDYDAPVRTHRWATLTHFVLQADELALNQVRPETTPSNVTASDRCPSGLKYLNTTERIRLNNDLTNWIDRHEKMNFVQLRHGKNPYLIYNSRKDLFPTGNASVKNADGNVTLSRIPANSTRKTAKPGRTESRLRRL